MRRRNGPLFWANASAVVQRIEHLARKRDAAHAVVLDLEATNQMDTTTAERLTDLLTRLRAGGIDVYLVRVFGNVRDVLTRSGFLDALGPDHVWHSIAVPRDVAPRAPADLAPSLPDLDDDLDTDLEASEAETEGEHIASKRPVDDAERQPEQP